MAKIYLADSRNLEELNKASRHLRRDGHQVDIFTNGNKLLSAIQMEAPDVLALSFFLSQQDGFEIINKQSMHLNSFGTRIIWITMMDALVPQTLMRSWVDERISGYLVEPFSYGQIVASVEQALFRQIITPLETVVQLRLECAAKLLSSYLRDHNNMFPDMTDWETVRSELRSYRAYPEINFEHPDPSCFFYPNASLSKRQWVQVKEPDKTFIFAEGSHVFMEAHWVVFFDHSMDYIRPVSDHLRPKVVHMPVHA